jgi:hypothetical protein
MIVLYYTMHVFPRSGRFYNVYNGCYTHYFGHYSTYSTQMQHTVIYIHLVLIKPFIYIIVIKCYIDYYTFYMHYTYFLSHNSAFNSCVGMHWHWLALVPDDDLCDSLPLEDPAGACTPPTPPGVPTHSPSPAPLRRAMDHVRPTSIPDLVSNMAGKDTTQKIDFDRHYMPDDPLMSLPSARGDADDHRSELKRKADEISRSLSEVFAYLTHGTASLEEAKTNVFRQLEDKKKQLAEHVPATIAICCCCCFILSNLFREEVEEHNSHHRGSPVIDPSEELIGVTNVLLCWYKLFCQTTPAKTPSDIRILRTLSNRLVTIIHIIHIKHIILLCQLCTLYVLCLLY